MATTFSEKFTKEIAPPFTAAARAAINQDWSKLDPYFTADAVYETVADAPFANRESLGRALTALAMLVFAAFSDSMPNSASGIRSIRLMVSKNIPAHAAHLSLVVVSSTVPS